MTQAVDSPRDVYLVSRALRGPQAPVAYTREDMLNALYLGSGNLGPEPFYTPLWAALEALIQKMEADPSYNP